jgi:hypothetical protein
MQGGTQTWDGLRLTWEPSPRIAAWEVIVSDHPIFDEEVADALAGRADFTAAMAFHPSVDGVIDNVTPRDSRGWYALLARSKEGERMPHPFRVGDAAASGRPVAPFFNANRTGELRAEVEEMLGQAREQLARWTAEQDRGARREAQRLVADALRIYPGFAAAQALLAEIG